MTNWCEIRVRLSDNGETSAQFDRLCKILDGDNPFNAIYPQPDWKNIPNEDGELPITEDHKDADGKVSLLFSFFTLCESVILSSAS